MQDEKLSLFRIPDLKNSQKTQSYLITLIDGTGSMVYEYESIIQAHEKVFSFLGNNQIKYQWEESLFSLQPFRNAIRGNISNTFRSIFEILTKSNQYPKNITFLFISDGEEPYNYNEILDSIKIMKENYQMQFISVAVGDEFPNSISNHLRNEIHNQNSDCKPIHFVKRDQKRFFIFCENNRPTEDIYQDFLQIFVDVKEQLQVYSGQTVIDQFVYKTLGQSEPTNLVQPNEIVAAPQSLKLHMDGQSIQPSNDIQTANEMLNKTIQQDLLIPVSIKSSEELKETCNRIQQREYDILNAVQPSQDQCEGLLPKIEIIEQIKEGILKPTELNDSQKTEIQVNLNKPNLDGIVEKIVEKQNPTLEGKLKLSQNRMSRNNTRPGCVIRCTSAHRKRIIENEAFKSLKIILDMFEQNSNQDLFVDLQQLKNETENQIQQKLIGSSDNSEEGQIVLRQLIELIKLLDQVLLKTKAQKNEIIALISKFLGSKDQIKGNLDNNDPYVQKYKNFNIVNQISSEIETLKCRLKVLLSQQFKSEKDSVQQFEKIMINCLQSCESKISRQKNYNQMRFDNNQLDKLIKEIIFEMKKSFKNLQMVFPKENFTSFRRVIGILYHLDTKIYQRQTLDVEELIEVFNQCIFSKGFIRDFVASIEAVACCDYDYLYRA